MASKKLLPIPWLEKNGLNINRKVRMVKMIAPICESCSSYGAGWWAECPHDPYHSFQEVPASKGDFVLQEDGTYSKGAAALGQKAYRRVPNVRQVGMHIRIRSKLGVQAQLTRGWKLPQDIKPNDEYDGYAPMCQFNNCYEALNGKNTVTCSAGDYCSTLHAKAALIKDRGEIIEAFDREKASRQLEAVSLT